MKIIRWYSGNTRFVLVIGFLAFKFAKINLFMALKCEFRQLFTNSHNVRRLVKKYGYVCPVSPLYWLLRGITANWLEWRYYRRTRLPILAPTYLSLGLVNIQAAGVYPQVTEKYFRSQISAIIGHDENNDEDIHADPHTLRQMENYIVFNGRLKIIDYGSPKSWTFLEKWGKKIFDEFIAL
ncbi:MAG: hypothetical protein WC668_02790 [Patescibacteria group bacterium]|jgi:hypothetical protein